jgi:hypothetical protein
MHKITWLTKVRPQCFMLFFENKKEWKSLSIFNSCEDVVWNLKPYYFFLLEN